MNSLATLSDDIKSKARDVSWLVLDVDGVMTDGSLIRGDDGQEYKRFSARDGLGMRLFREAGFKTAIITARTSKVVADRASELGITEVHQGKHDKKAVLLEMCDRLGISPDQTAFMGDDLVDYKAMSAAGISLTVADAYPVILQHADWISQYPGGRGAVREACEMLLYCNDQLDDAIASFTDSGTT